MTPRQLENYDKELWLINKAQEFEIALTAAEPGTDEYQDWVDWVRQAERCFDRGDMRACLDAVEKANQIANERIRQWQH